MSSREYQELKAENILLKQELAKMAQQTEVQTILAKLDTMADLMTQMATEIQTLKTGNAAATANAQTITDNATAINGESPKADAAITAAQTALAA